MLKMRAGVNTALLPKGVFQMEEEAKGHRKRSRQGSL
jgi:hypothetical protein